MALSTTEREEGFSVCCADVMASMQALMVSSHLQVSKGNRGSLLSQALLDFFLGRTTVVPCPAVNCYIHVSAHGDASQSKSLSG